MSTDYCDGCGNLCTAETMHPIGLGQAALCSKCWKSLCLQVIQEILGHLKAHGYAATQRKFHLTLFEVNRLVDKR